MEDKKQTVTDILEEVVQEVCENLCRFPFEYKGEDQEQMTKDHCENCPLNRLGY